VQIGRTTVPHMRSGGSRRGFLRVDGVMRRQVQLEQEIMYQVQQVHVQL
jgi:hypothetical protein